MTLKEKKNEPVCKRTRPWPTLWGPDANVAEVSGFTPTRYELLTLVEYWTFCLLDTQFSCFIMGGSEHYTLSVYRHALDRLAVIDKALDDPLAVLAATKRGRAAFRKTVRRDAWHVFTG